MEIEIPTVVTLAQCSLSLARLLSSLHQIYTDADEDICLSDKSMDIFRKIRQICFVLSFFFFFNQRFRYLFLNVR